MQKIIKTIGVLVNIIIINTLLLNTAVAELPVPKGILVWTEKDAPSLVLKDLDGQVYDIRQSKGKWVFMHFWASWCGPCRKELPLIDAIVPLFKDSRMDIVLVNTSEDEDTVFSFLGDVAPELTTLMDSDGKVTANWKPRGLPSTYLVSPDGKLAYVVLGGRAWNQPVYLKFLQGLMKTR